MKLSKCIYCNKYVKPQYIGRIHNKCRSPANIAVGQILKVGETMQIHSFPTGEYDLRVMTIPHGGVIFSCYKRTPL